MIRVTLKPEPENFNNKVRLAGNNWMKDNPGIDVSKGGKFWRKCLDDLHSTYDETCAYLAYRIHRVDVSVDHFAPVSLRPDLAFEWNNYRLAHREVNSTKDNSCDVLDPFEIEDDYFKLNKLTGEVYANETLPQELLGKIDKTIEVLRLNKIKYCEHRLNIINACENDMDNLKYESPFVHYAVQ